MPRRRTMENIDGKEVMIMREIDVAANQLANEIAEKEKTVISIEEEIKSIRKRQDEDTVLQDLNIALTNAERERRQLYDKIQKMRNTIISKFTTDEHYPYFTRSSQYGYSVETNVRDMVLEAIKKHVGAISKLAGGDIEDIVRKLIEKEVSKNTELSELEKRDSELEDRQSKLREQIYHHPSEMDITRLSTAKYHLSQELTKLKEIQSNPKRVQARAEREKMRALGQNYEILDKILAEIK